MDIDLGWGVDRYVDILVADHVLGNDGTTNRRTAITAVDVDSHTPRSGGVEGIGKVPGNGIADDFISTSCHLPELQKRVPHECAERRLPVRYL